MTFLELLNYQKVRKSFGFFVHFNVITIVYNTCTWYLWSFILGIVAPHMKISLVVIIKLVYCDLK